MSTPIPPESSALPVEESSPGTEDTLRLEPARATVLVVEDDPAQRELLSELLHDWGYAPVPAGSAEEAEILVSQHPVDAAVVDIFLPGQSGTQLLARLRERFPDAVLVGVSGLDDATLSRRCKGQGADRFLGKPVSPEHLAEALQAPHISWH